MPKRPSGCVAVCGFMGSGKSYCIGKLCERLGRAGVRYRIVRGRALFPSFHLSGLRRKRPADSTAGAGGTWKYPKAVPWGRRWNVVRAADAVAAAAVFLLVRAANRGRVVLCDRYLYDAFAHYRDRGVWHRLVWWAAPSPGLTLVLVPGAGTVESRVAERGPSNAEEAVRSRVQADARTAERIYLRMAEGLMKGRVVVLDTRQPEAIDTAWRHLLSEIGKGATPPGEGVVDGRGGDGPGAA